MLERSSTSNRSHRGSLHVAVFLRMGCQPVVLPLSGTKDAGVEPSKDYSPLTKLGMEEYKDNVEPAFAELGNLHGEGVRTRGQARVLLHDRDPSHKGWVPKQWAEQKGIKVVLLPEASPDLTPLDASFFGSVHTRWRKECLEKKLGWPDRALLFKQLLEETDPDRHIQHWLRAVRACVQERGGHVERRSSRRGS